MAEKGQESRPSLSKTNEETISSPRGNTWGYEETVSLLEVWAEDTMQRDLENTPKRNMDTYRKIVEQINVSVNRVYVASFSGLSISDCPFGVL
jgi:GTP cyclohydrolase I